MAADRAVTRFLNWCLWTPEVGILPLFTSSGSWKAQGLWKWIHRTVPDQYDRLKNDAKELYGSLPHLFAAFVKTMAEVLILDEYQQVLLNCCDQGALTVTPLGNAAFAMPDTCMSEEEVPKVWKVVDLELPYQPRWCTGD